MFFKLSWNSFKNLITTTVLMTFMMLHRFHSAASMGSMYRPSAGAYDDRYEGRYGSRDGDRNVDSYGREREYGFRDDRSGGNEDSYGRDYEDRYNRDGYRDDDYRGRSRSVDDYQYGSRSRSSDRNGERTYDDGQVSSRYAHAADIIC